MFNMSINDKFHIDSQDRDISYGDYLLEQYKVQIYDRDQPLIRCHMKRTEEDIYLIPEACVLTGITEKQKAQNFRDIRPDMFADANKKMQQSRDFFQAIKEDKAYMKESEKWKI